jgi:hypothetical protein
MRQPIDYQESTFLDLIEDLHPLARVALSIVATFLMAAVAFLIGLLIVSLGI